MTEVNKTNGAVETPTAVVMAGPANGVVQQHSNANGVQLISQLTREQVGLLKDTICKGATDDELALFVEVCKKKRLDPFSKQIHMVKRWDAELGRHVMSYQTGIDGFRVMGERGQGYAGQDGPYWCGKDGEWKDVWMDDKPPVAAKVGIFRSGFAKPIYGVALYREYVQTKKDGTPNAMWFKMPASQLAKCAESLAWRKAFPDDFGGIYTSEEMAQAAYADESPNDQPPPPQPQQGQRQQRPANTAPRGNSRSQQPPPPQPQQGQRQQRPANTAPRGNSRSQQPPPPQPQQGQVIDAQCEPAGPPPMDPWQPSDADLPAEMGGTYVAEPPVDRVAEARARMEERPCPAEKPWVNFKQMIACFEQIRSELGDTWYYKVLNAHGVAHSNEFKSGDAAWNCYRELWPLNERKRIHEARQAAQGVQ